MIKIESNKTRNLKAISGKHYLELEPILKANIRKVSDTKLKNYLNKNLSKIINAKPEDLLNIHEEYKKECGISKKRLKYYNKQLPKVFDYDWFSKKRKDLYCAYHLAKDLGVNTCPYCNRGYTVTVDKNRIQTVRPDIDHFYPQDDYPILALSFYNLIPSCLICNRTLKGKKPTASCLNPYSGGFDNALKFTYIMKDVASAKGYGNSYLVKLEKNALMPTKAEACINNAKLFKLEEIYEVSHSGEIADIIRKHEMSGGRYLEVLMKTFPNLGTFDELYKIAFGNYYNYEDFEKRPLSKLTRDIVEQLQFVAPVPPKTV